MISGLVSADPLREGPRRLLMLVLYRAGRHAEALTAFRDACAALEEIGLQPGPELRALEGAILRHDDSLLAPSTAARLRSDDARTVACLESVQSLGCCGSGGVPAGQSAEMPLAAGRRKVVTALFWYVTGSTALGLELDPELQRRLMGRVLSEIRTTIERHGGTVDKLIGEGVLAVFGIPRVREDDALRAVRAAVEISGRLPALASGLGVTLRLRAGINTALVLTGDGEISATGEAVNVAARLAHGAGPGEIVLGSDTWSLVRDAVEVDELGLAAEAGQSEPIPAFRLVAVDPLAPGVARRLNAPLVGPDPRVARSRGGVAAHAQ